MESHAPLATSRQPDPAEPVAFPEYAAATDARGPAVPVLDIGVEHGARRVAAFLTFAAAVVTVLALGVVYADPTPLGLAVAALLTVATLVARRAWLGRPALDVTLTGSRLEVTGAQQRHVFDLASPACAVDVVGVPGERGWRVLFHRRGMAPYVLHGRQVDAGELTRALHRHRPEVRYLPAARS